MKKFILGTALLTSAFTTMLMAQSKLLAKTTWKIENIAANGNIVLKNVMETAETVILQIIQQFCDLLY